MDMFNHQLVAGAVLSQACCSGAAVGGSAGNFTRYLTRRVQAVLMQHHQAYVQHVEVVFNNDAGSYLLLDLEHLQRFRHRLNTRIAQTLAAKGFWVKAGLRCEWFSTNGHHGHPNFHLLVFLEQRAFCLLGDERESSQTVLNRHIAATWAGVQEFSAPPGGHLPNTKPQGGFYLSDKAGDSGVAVLIEAMRNVSECEYAST